MVIWIIIFELVERTNGKKKLLMRIFLPSLPESTWPWKSSNMPLKNNKIAILCLLAISCLSVEARRRSRIDIPVQNATSTPLELNIITTIATEKTEAEKLEQSTAAPTTIQTDLAEEERVSESNSSEESPAYEDCDLDNISFEMITG